MFEKIKSLEKIKKLNMNYHDYTIPESFMAFVGCCVRYGEFTIRMDSDTITDDLPFFIKSVTVNLFGDIRNDDITWCYHLWVTYHDGLGYRFIVSDGIKYDNIQDYNIVAKIECDGEFVFEASDLKRPLRHMYRSPEKLLCCSGNIKDDISQWNIINNIYGIDRRKIKRDLETMYTYQQHGKWLECTKYPIGVGVKKENTVIWQIR